MMVWNGASADVGALEVKNNPNGIVVSLRSSIRIYDTSTISDNGIGIYGVQGAGITVSAPAIVANNGVFALYCLDTESSFSGVTSGFMGQVNCSGF